MLAAPDDDAPRLVYADWLLERGDLLGPIEPGLSARFDIVIDRDPAY